MSRIFPFLFFTLISFQIRAQSEQPPYTEAEERIDSYRQRMELEERSIANAIEFRSAGPTVFSGRVADLDVWEKDPSHFYVGYASGGLWKTTNNGISFTPLFDEEMVMTIGDIAVDWERDVIWVGTGEVNASRSSYAGVGMYKSEDGGNTWQYRGLPESHHIGRVLIHPDDPNTVWAAVLGHLYSPNPERGIYKTTNGGESWEKTLYVDENSGAVDLLMDPNNPDILYAATWDRTRRAWDFVESGAGSGIYKSTDRGETWQLLTDEKSGFPTGEGAGRIGLAIGEKDGQQVLYAAIDNYFRRPKEDQKEDILAKEELREMDKEEFLQVEKYLVKDYLQRNGFPREYSVEKIREMIQNEEIRPIALVEYVEDANSLLFDTPVIGLEVYRSTDGGQNWEKTHDNYLDRVYNSYGYYFGQIRTAPENADKLYVMGVPVLRSDDGGASWTSIQGDNVHADHHALWANPDRPGHLILGNDGGVNISYDDGENWIKCNTPAVGQFYAVAVDMAEPYNIYGGLQDNGVWMGPGTYESSTEWHGSGQYPYREIMGGDGMQVAVDTRDNATVYTGFQFGNYYRLNTKTGERQYITPKHKLGERPLRWNWQTPVHLSAHNQDILYMGSNKMHRSLNQGDDFEEISPDLTTGGRKGDVAFSTLTTIHESPLRFGLLYAGTDDGLVHVSRDGGSSWQRITDGFPENMWVTRVFASAFDEGTVYVSLNGYRWDDFSPYVYMSTDYGQSWERIGEDLPLEPVNTVEEDPENPNLLYVGTDHGLYISLDKGKSFMLLNNQLPAVAVHDVVVHPRERELIVGTHGRSIYLGNVRELQQLTEELMASPLHVFKMESIRYRSRWGNTFADWAEPSEPEVHIPLYSNTPGKTSITVKMGDLTLKEFEADCVRGLNYLPYDLSLDGEILNEYQEILNEDRQEDEMPIKLEKADNGKIYLYEGQYEIIVEKDGETKSTSLEIK